MWKPEGEGLQSQQSTIVPPGLWEQRGSRAPHHPDTAPSSLLQGIPGQEGPLLIRAYWYKEY